MLLVCIIDGIIQPHSVVMKENRKPHALRIREKVKQSSRLILIVKSRIGKNCHYLRLEE